MRAHGPLRFAAVLLILAVCPPSHPLLADGERAGGVDGTATSLAAPGSTTGLATPSLAPLTSVAAPMQQFRTFTLHGNFAAAGTGMRNKGFGTITIAGIPTDATVVGAYLYWVVLNPTMPAATGIFATNSISGTFLGSGANPCWGGRDESNTLVDAGSAWTFRADVKAYVPSPGNGSYALAGFPSGESGGQDPFLDFVNDHLPLMEGASLVIVYFSPSEPQRDIVVYDGNASVPDTAFNDTSILTLTGFQISPTGTPSARFAFIGADGQTNYPDQDLFNSTVLTALGASPWDGSDGPQYTYGSLWDTDIFDVSTLLSPGATSATATVHTPTEGYYDCLVWSAAVLAVTSTDPSPPLCQSSTSGTGATAVVNGSATDSQPGDTGIVSVDLDPSSTNIVCPECPQTYLPGVPSVTFSLYLTSGATSGSGSVIVTDGAGKTCRVGASYTGITQGAVTDQALFIDKTQGVKFFVAQGTALTSDTAVVDSSPPALDDLACLPACFEFPPKSLVLTVTSPLDGPASVDYDIDIASDPDLRLLSRHPDASGSCPYQDITTSVQDIVFDPRLRGTVSYSRVQFVAGRQIAGCAPSVATDADGDLYFAGGSTDPAVADCDDANPNINPGATEICNGIDDNCDGQIDEGNPGGGVSCPVPGLLGVCAAGLTQCVNGGLVCNQTVFPTAEACDGKDNNCNGVVDEGFDVGAACTAIVDACHEVIGTKVCRSDGTGTVCSGAISLHDTTPPSITCPGSLTLECPATSSSIGTTSATDICDPAPKVVSNAPTTLPLGTTVVTWTATDASGNSSACQQSVTVVDTTAPTLVCPAPVIVQCAGPAGALVQLQASATDSCSAVSVLNSRIGSGANASGTYPIGTTTVTFTATDSSGNSSTCQASVTVNPIPIEISIGLTPTVLWPPNHRMIDVQAAVTATGGCNLPGTGPTVALTSVTSNEPDNAPGTGDGNTIDDIQGTQPGSADFDFQLRAERDGTGSGRAYTVTYTATDGAGFTGTQTAFVFVPHDRSGVTEPVIIALTDSTAGTSLSWSEVPEAIFYSAIRGNVSSLQEMGASIDLGAVTCIAADLPGVSTIGHEDIEVPAPGDAFFYLVAYANGWSSSYGTDSVSKPRVPTSGGCP